MGDGTKLTFVSKGKKAFRPAKPANCAKDRPKKAIQQKVTETTKIEPLRMGNLSFLLLPSTLNFHGHTGVAINPQPSTINQ